MHGFGEEGGGAGARYIEEKGVGVTMLRGGEGKGISSVRWWSDLLGFKSVPHRRRRNSYISPPSLSLSLSLYISIYLSI